MTCYPSGLTVGSEVDKSFFQLLVDASLDSSSKLYFCSLVVLMAAIGFVVAAMVCC